MQSKNEYSSGQWYGYENHHKSTPTNFYGNFSNFPFSFQCAEKFKSNFNSYCNMVKGEYLNWKKKRKQKIQISLEHDKIIQNVFQSTIRNSAIVETAFIPFTKLKHVYK